MGQRLDHLNRVSRLIQQPTTMFVTATFWRELAAEFRDMMLKHPEDFVDPLNFPTPRNFKALRMPRGLTVVNAGTEDQEVVDLANVEAERKSRFREAHDRFAIRPSEKKEVEAVDAASTHAVPEEVIAEAEDRIGHMNAGDRTSGRALWATGARIESEERTSGA